mgnify:CR=1 FL=1|jgi:Anti-anti-sigma regulatory factor (antagonist of anti-sigma factor)
MVERDAPPHILKLPAVLDLNAASRLHEQVLALKDRDVAVDASEVTRVGTQCIQILLSAVRSWRAMDMTFSVNQASDAFAKTLQLLGIADEEMIPMEIVQ